MMPLKQVATIICDNEWDNGNRGCTETATFEAPLTEKDFEKKARAYFLGKGWTIDPDRCPYCVAGRPSDEN